MISFVRVEMKLVRGNVYVGVNIKWTPTDANIWDLEREKKREHAMKTYLVKVNTNVVTLCCNLRLTLTTTIYPSPFHSSN